MDDSLQAERFSSFPGSLETFTLLFIEYRGLFLGKIIPKCEFEVHLVHRISEKIPVFPFFLLSATLNYE